MPSRFLETSLIQRRREERVALYKDHSITQTFDVDVLNLSSITIEFNIENYKNIFGHKMDLYIRDEISQTTLKSFRKSTSLIFFNPLQNISFSKELIKPNHPYSLIIQTDSPKNTISLHCSKSNAFDNGSLLIENINTDFDLTFYFYRKPNIRDFINLFNNSLRRFMLIGKMLFLISSVGLIPVLFVKKLDFSQLIQSCVNGLVMIPIFFFILSYFKHRTFPYIFLLYSFFLLELIIIIWKFFRQISHFKNNESSLRIGYQIRILDVGYYSLFLFFFIFSLIIKTIQIDEIYAPLWMDGLIHQNLFTNNVELESVSSNPYPLGFHYVIGFLKFLLPKNSAEIILVLGQLLVCLSMISVFLLAKKIYANKFIPFFCSIIYGYFFKFPSYLISWGRYPVLMGLTILPLAMLMIINLSKTEYKSMPLVIFASIALLLTHYGLFISLVIFLICFLFQEKFFRSDMSLFKNIKDKILFICPTIIFLSLLIYKLFIFFSNYALFKIEKKTIKIDFYNELFYIIQNIFQDGNWFLFFMGMFSLFFLSRRIQKKIGLFKMWILLLCALLFFSVFILCLPILSITNLYILFSIPFSLSIANLIEKNTKYLVFLNGHLLNSRKINYYLVIILIVIGFINNLSVINPQTIFVTEKDHMAYEWINKMIEPNSNFLVNSYYWNNMIFPSDSGGWLPHFTNNRIIYMTSGAQDSYQYMKENEFDYYFMADGNSLIDINYFINDNSNLIYNNGKVKIYKNPQ